MGFSFNLAHGYLFANVLDNTVNLRNDKYGYNDEGRFSLIRKTIQAVKHECGDKFSVIVKLSSNNKALTPYDEHLLYYATELGNCRVDAIEVSGTDFTKRSRDESAYYLEKAFLIKHVANVPVMLVGGIYTLSTMEKALKQGIDMISCARPFICEPDFALKLKAGAEFSKCIRCWQCFKLYNTEHKNCVFLPKSEQLRHVYSFNL